MSRLRSAQALLLLALLMSPMLCIQLDPSRVSEAEYSVLQSRTIRSTSNDVFNLSLNVSLPYDGHIVLSPPSSRLHADSFGNPYLSIWEQRPEFPYTFAINSTVSIQSEVLRKLPDKSGAGPDLSTFLRSNADVPSADPAMSALALSITANSTDDFEAVAKLARYVHSLIKYDAEMVGQRPKVMQILANPQGVCTEYSLLFVTLARASGYPARFVGGYAYSEDVFGWQGHSWAEVWLGQWVPVDPTWLEVGTLDATHIPLTRTADPDSQTLSVSAMFIVPSGTPANQASGGELELEQELPGAAPIDEIVPLSITETPARTPMPLNSSSQKLPIGGRAVVWAEYASDRYGLLDARLTPCTGKQGPILEIPSQSQSLITKPGKTHYLVWEVQISPDLDAGYDYRCPLSFGADGYDMQPLPLTISDRASADWLILSAEIENSLLLPGETLRVFAHSPPSMAGQDVHLLSADTHLVSKFDGNGQASFEFIPTAAGFGKLYVFSSLGDPRTLTYAIQSSSSPALNLSGSILPISQHEPFNVTVQVRGIEPKNYRSPLRVSWAFESERGELPLSSSSERLNIELKSDSAGQPLLLVRLLDSSGTELARSVRSFFIYSPSDISVSSVTLPTTRAEILVLFKRDGDAHDVRLHVGNASWYVGEQEQLSIALPPGLHAARFSWIDQSGRTREKEFILNAGPDLSSAYPADFSQTLGGSHGIDPIIFSLVIAVAAALVVLLMALRRRHNNDGFSTDFDTRVSSELSGKPPSKPW